MTATTIAQCLKLGTAALRQQDVPNPRFDAQLLMSHATGFGRLALLTESERPLSAEEQAAFDAMIERRCKREPVSHIIGRREFWSLDFHVNKHVLDPRPDSETLIAAVLGCIENKAAPLSILDLGTGSGCLLLALLSELPNARGTGIDISRPALDVCAANAMALGLSDRVRFLQGDWALGLSGPFNVIVTNPPYITDQDMGSLAPEVARHEPHGALSGGLDGLDAYRRLIPQTPRLLDPNGFIALEIGQGQVESVGALLTDSGLEIDGIHNDLAGIPRCLTAKPGK